MSESISKELWRRREVLSYDSVDPSMHEAMFRGVQEMNSTNECKNVEALRAKYFAEEEYVLPLSESELLELRNILGAKLVVGSFTSSKISELRKLLPGYSSGKGEKHRRREQDEEELLRN